MKKVIVAVLAAVLALGFIAPEVEMHYALQRSDGPNPDHPTIVMLGDSHTTVPNWPLLVKCHNVANFGIGGNTSAQMLSRLPSVIAANPKIVLIMAGTNDAIQKIEFSATVSNLNSMKADLNAKGIESVILSPPPLPEHEASIKLISDIATLKIPFTESDLLSDGIHLRRSGYAKWRDAIAPIVDRDCFTH
jgi:hypothetical protein